MTLAPWEYLFDLIQQPQLPGPVPSDLDRRGGPAGRADRPVQRPDAGAPSPSIVYVDMWEWLWWTGLITFSLLLVESLFVFDYFIVLLTQIIGIADARLDPVPALPADPARVRVAAGPRALLHEAEVRRPRGHDPAPRRPTAAAPARRPPLTNAWLALTDAHRDPSASGWATDDRTGPPGTTGVTGQVIHSDARGLVAELAFARGARVEPHANPNTTWMIVIEGGGWVGVAGERTRIAAGEAVLLAGGHPPRGLDRALRDARDHRRVRRRGRFRCSWGPRRLCAPADARGDRRRASRRGFVGESTRAPPGPGLDEGEPA